ncbi:MAG: HDOD domain-containing protein [Pseudomonadota bacterium]|nr:HDOD domain-containing protein [Pseudomonadota bacterium]
MLTKPAYLMREAIIDSALHVRGYFLSLGGQPQQATTLCEILHNNPVWPFRNLQFILDAIEAPDILFCEVDSSLCSMGIPWKGQVTQEIILGCLDKGFSVAVTDAAVHRLRASDVPMANIFMVDVGFFTEEKLLQYISSSSKPFSQLIATGINSLHSFTVACRAGFERFTSSHFLEPVYQSNKPVTAAHIQVIELLDLLRKDADDSLLEEVFKHDVTLSFKILRYINSAGFGLMCEIESIRHAIQVLGRKPLYRWLTLLLATSGTSSPPALTKTAVIRGRFVELLGFHLLDKRELDSLFIAGVFSLLDVILERPMEEALECLSLPETITDALLNRTGVFAPFIDLAIACEGRDVELVDKTALFLGLSEEQVNNAHIQALAWVEELSI